MADLATALEIRRACGAGLAALRRLRLRLDFRLGLVYALLWGAAVTALESIAAAPLVPEGVSALPFFASLLLLWASRGAVLALTAQWVEGALPTRWIAALFAAEVLLLSLAWDGVIEASLLQQRLLGLPLPLNAHFLYNFWVLAAYGGPFFWFCLMGQRMRRAADVLARAAVERSRTAAMVHEAQFESLKGRIDPALLYRAISALKALYALERERAEALLDALGAFLRHAMPGLRQGRSTLLTELALLRAHAQLMQCIDDGSPPWQLDIDVAATDVPFPPLLLLPLVERLRVAQAPPGAPVRVELTTVGAGLKLLLKGATHGADWIGDDLARQLQTALRTVYGNDGRWLVGGAPSLTLWLPLPPAEPKQEVSDERQG